MFTKNYRITDEKLKPKIQIENRLFIAWINRWGHILIRYSIYK